MDKLFALFSPQKRLWQQQREIQQLRQEVTKLRQQNDGMRQGMRRCVTCDYRIDFKQRQGGVNDSQPLSPRDATEND